MADEEGNAAPAESGGGEEMPQEEKDFRDFAGVEHDAPSDPSWDNKRFRQIYRKSKDSERSAQQLRDDLKAAGEHTRRMAEAMEKFTKVTVQKGELDLKSKADSILAEAEQIEAGIASLKAERRSARTAMDWDKVDELEDQIKAAEKKADKKRSEAEAAAKETKDKPAAEPEIRPDLKAIQDFTQETPWFNPGGDDFNPRMTAAAKEYDTYLMNKAKYKGRVDLTAERLKEVRAYIEKDFGWTTDGNGELTPKPRISLVEGVGREQNSGGRQNVTVALTPEEKRVAHNMMPDLDPAKAESEYLKQKKILGGA